MQVAKSNQESPLGGLTDKYSEVYEEGLGTFKGPEVKSHVDPEARPKFLKVRPVLYAMTGKIEGELKRLQDEGTIEPVQFSEWAAPIVSLLQPDDSVRIRGDYKSTVNQVSKLDSYPIPKVEDLLATLQCWLTTSEEQVCVHGTASNLHGSQGQQGGNSTIRLQGRRHHQCTSV